MNPIDYEVLRKIEKQGVHHRLDRNSAPHIWNLIQRGMIDFQAHCVDETTSRIEILGLTPTGKQFLQWNIRND